MRCKGIEKAILLREKNIQIKEQKKNYERS